MKPVIDDPRTRPIDGVGDIVLMASGKGGVGKSTLAVNIACGLAARGVRVGVLDADLAGPSIARLMGTPDHLDLTADGRAKPVRCHGVFCLSVAQLMAPEQVLAWKGPLVAQAVRQLVHQVAWPSIDVLLIDMPPGTGDVYLSMLEDVPIAGAVVVATPQRLAVIDAERAIDLFHQHDVPVFGLVENMGSYVCPCCATTIALYDGRALRALGRRRHVALLGRVPLDPAGQPDADRGRPMLVTRPDGPVADAIGTLVARLQAALAREHAARAQ